jgi:hypothetical protein
VAHREQPAADAADHGYRIFQFHDATAVMEQPARDEVAQVEALRICLRPCWPKKPQQAPPVVEVEPPPRALARRLLPAQMLPRRLEPRVLARLPPDGDDEQGRLRQLRPVPALLQAVVALPLRDVGVLPLAAPLLARAFRAPIVHVYAQPGHHSADSDDFAPEDPSDEGG